MDRIFGMMPPDEIEKTAEFNDQYDMRIGIDAGPHGWTVRWADFSCTYADVDDTTENNFQKALDSVKSRGFTLTPVEENAEVKAEGSESCGCGGMCGDDRFEIIEAAKKKLIESTDIETSKDEMAVLDSILFRMWQMNWLPGCKKMENGK